MLSSSKLYIITLHDLPKQLKLCVTKQQSQGEQNTQDQNTDVSEKNKRKDKKVFTQTQISLTSNIYCWCNNSIGWEQWESLDADQKGVGLGPGGGGAANAGPLGKAPKLPYLLNSIHINPT